MTCSLPLLLPLACKDPETAAAQARAQSLQARLTEGRAHLASGLPEQAIQAFQAAVHIAPNEVEPRVLMAEAHRQAGDNGAAILALKQAEALLPGDDPALQKQIAELYCQEGLVTQALSTFLTLRDAGQLTDPELLSLAQLQAHTGDLEGASQTLERILRVRPDDPDAKVVEAELLLLKGEELLAAVLMDRLLNKDPRLTAARLLRVRYFLNNGYPEEAQKDLSQIEGEEALRPEVVTLRARILNVLRRHAEAEAALTGLVEARPGDVDALAQLAETKLLLGRQAEAQQLVEKALRLRPRLARALYVRARALEEQGELKGAEENYRYALTSDPVLAPALSRTWRLYQQSGRATEARAALERLFFLNEASHEEKATLAQMYVEARTHLERSRNLIEEVLRREPDNPRYLAVKAALLELEPPKKPTGPLILGGDR